MGLNSLFPGSIDNRSVSQEKIVPLLSFKFQSYSISWNHLVSLRESDRNSLIPGLYLTKIKNEHINLKPSSRMSVRLAAQVRL